MENNNERFRTDLITTDNVKKLYGFYRGLVLDNRDPAIDKEKKSYGRIKVYIPALMDDSKVGIWAYPANNPIGGRNTESISDKKDSNGGKQEYAGTFYVPPANSYVWVFFENGDPNRPFYFSGLDIKAHEAPPEIIVESVSKPEERWVIFHSPQGRVIIVSDDPKNCRTEITGKKRQTPSNTEDYVYKIDGNQKTILIDEREGKEKILIKDEKGNFINLRSNKDSIEIHANDVIKINADNAIYLSSKHLGMSFETIHVSANEIGCSTSGVCACESSGQFSMRSSSMISFDAPSIKTNCGSSVAPNNGNSSSEAPNGERE